MKMVNLDELVETLHEENDRVAKAQENGEAKQSDENFLSLSAGHTYLLRLLPNVANKAKTFAPYEEYGFKCVNTGHYKYLGQTPTSVGRKDLVRDIQWKTYSEAKDAGDEAEMKRSYSLFPQKKQMVNVYVVENTENPELNGTVKILRYSAKTGKDGSPVSPIFSKIHAAIFGDDKKEIGKRAFDLTANGVSFSIKVKKNSGGWNDYSESSFKFPSDIGLTESQISEIYSSTKDLEKFLPDVKTDSELKELMDIHWFGKAPDSSEEAPLSDDSDEIDLSPKDSSSAELDDDSMDDFLSGLDLIDDTNK